MFDEEGTVYTNVESSLVQHWRATGRRSGVEVYRANHHGSAHSSNRDLAGALDPAVVVYSAGENSYGHPDPSTLAEFSRARQYVTSGYDTRAWPNGLDLGVELVHGDVEVEVLQGGALYTVNGKVFASRLR